jgi:hypothetical protein
VKLPCDNRDAPESYLRKNTELDPDHPRCWRWRGRPVKFRRYRKKDGVLRSIYQIAFEIFVGPVPDGHVVHHTCENIHCINPEHLKALTPREHNKVHLIGKFVLSDNAVREIFHLITKGMLQREVAEIYGVTQPCISNLVHNRSWRHIYAEVFQEAKPIDFRFRSGFARRRGS